MYLHLLLVDHGLSPRIICGVVCMLICVEVCMWCRRNVDQLQAQSQCQLRCLCPLQVWSLLGPAGARETYTTRLMDIRKISESDLEPGSGRVKVCGQLASSAAMARTAIECLDACRRIHEHGSSTCQHLQALNALRGLAHLKTPPDISSSHSVRMSLAMSKKGYRNAGPRTHSG